MVWVMMMNWAPVLLGCHVFADGSIPTTCEDLGSCDPPDSFDTGGAATELPADTGESGLSGWMTPSAEFEFELDICDDEDHDGDGWSECAGDCNDDDVAITPDVHEGEIVVPTPPTGSVVDCSRCGEDPPIDEDCDGEINENCEECLEER